VKVLLRSDVAGLGQKGDIVEVADGYGRNYLLPKGFAVLASGGVAAQAESMRRSREQRDAVERAAADELAARLGAASIALSARAKGEGELFGSVSITEIVDAVSAQLGVDLDRHLVHLDAPIRTVGSHQASVRLHPQVEVRLGVEVSAA